jgi:hypothetical protein
MGVFMEEDQLLKVLRSTIITIARQIKREGCSGDRLNNFGKLVNSYSKLYERVKKQAANPNDFFEIPTKVKKKPDV